MGLAVGIDLGTTFSAIAWINEFQKPEVIKNQEDQLLTPSVVAVCETPPLVGSEAKELQALGEDGVASFFKRAMGDPVWRVEAASGAYTPVDLSALVVRKLKQDAEARLQQSITDAVITVPAYFNNDQREATKAAGEQAGLNVLMTINEPTAAALAFGLGGHKITGNVLVYDLGGGTFDITLIDISADNIQVIATDGDHELGGKDWDDRIANYAANQFYDEHGEHPLDDSISYNDVIIAAEQAKVNLSTMTSTRMRLTHAGIRAAYPITREQFEHMSQDLLERTAMLTERVLTEQGLQWDDLQAVLLVGGSTRMPMIKDFVTQRGQEPVSGVNVDEAVALGAAIQASQMAGPSSGQRRFTLPGAVRFQDVTSHSLGMIALNDDRSAYLNSIILAKNQAIPSQDTRPYKLRTSPRGDNRLEVYITQGESTVPAQCAFIGKYTAENVPHAPQGEGIIDITYAYDQSGIVQVMAQDRVTGQALTMHKEPVPDDMSWVERPPEITQAMAPAHIVVYLCIDVSGSMSGSPLAEAQRAAEHFVGSMDLSSSSVGLIAFGSHATRQTQASQNARQIQQAIQSLSITGSTNMADAFHMARRELAAFSSDDPRFIVLLTDGDPDSRSETTKAAHQCRADGIDVVTIGTSGADQRFLAQLASTDEANVFAQSGQLVDVFGSIAQQITEGGGRLRKL
ncbi:MAG: hypothetical protein ETSY1_02170 [Candidatus Entotheonella factor]|uniref:VWFA domain-containing protein n=1 Tax=Entotheonella factor TaxID=1429438 RepID=W4LY16_ENTF1|nr:Hsp70 family protein [Candidatus Entotheonella palauensis]ETX02810.1 MAG: hypothetical protein ETSY1_02170 [Candidatus Entotheonella factor]